MHNLSTFKQITPQLAPSDWMQLFNCTTWYPSRMMLSLPITSIFEIWTHRSTEGTESIVQMGSMVNYSYVDNSHHWLMA